MFSIDTEISLIALFIFIIGPAFVFVQSVNTIFRLMVFLILRRDTFKDTNPDTPHKQYATYVFYPIGLAFVLWLLGWLDKTPYQGFEQDYLSSILKPKWLLEYSLFAFTLGLTGTIFGLIMGSSIYLWRQIPIINRIFAPPSDSKSKQLSDRRNRRRP